MTAPIRKPDDRYEPYRVVTDYEGLHEAFRDRIEDLDVSRAEIDAAAGLQSGYAAKLLSTHPKKRFGPNSLGGLLKATGTALVMVVDDEGFAPVRATLTQRKRKMQGTVPCIAQDEQETPISSEQLIREHMRKLGKKGSKLGKSNGAKRRMKEMGKRARQRIASHAARKRWSKRNGA